MLKDMFLHTVQNDDLHLSRIFDYRKVRQDGNLNHRSTRSNAILAVLDVRRGHYCLSQVACFVHRTTNGTAKRRIHPKTLT